MLELCFPFDGDGAFIGPMAMIFAMEVTKWCFFSSAPLFSSAFLATVFAIVSFFAARPVITGRPVFVARPIIVMISATPALVMPGFP